MASPVSSRSERLRKRTVSLRALSVFCYSVGGGFLVLMVVMGVFWHTTFGIVPTVLVVGFPVLVGSLVWERSKPAYEPQEFAARVAAVRRSAESANRSEERPKD
jgi:hypothetical protein